MTNKDWTGRPVPDDETDDTVITVWTITPSGDTNFDYIVGRGYQDAVRCAKNVVQDLMDDVAGSELPIKVEIDRQEMTRGDYLDAIESGSKGLRNVTLINYVGLFCTYLGTACLIAALFWIPNAPNQSVLDLSESFNIVWLWYRAGVPILSIGLSCLQWAKSK